MRQPGAALLGEADRTALSARGPASIAAGFGAQQSL
jgi:hypothetical protein